MRRCLPKPAFGESEMSCPTPPRVWLKNDKIKIVSDLALLDGLLLAADTVSQCIWQIDSTSYSLLGCEVGDQYVEVESFAGVAGQSGYNDGPSADARFDYPARLAVDQYGKTVYVCDLCNERIRKIHDDMVKTFAGDFDNVLTSWSILVREDRSVVFLLMDMSSGKSQINRVSLDGNMTVIAEFFLLSRYSCCDDIFLYNDPQGSIILCDNSSLDYFEIRDGDLSPIKSQLRDTCLIAGYSSKLKSVYMFHKRGLFRQRLTGDEEEECVCYTDKQYGGYFKGYFRLVNDDDHTVYAFKYSTTIVVIALKPDPCKAFRLRPTINFVSSYAQLLDNEDLASRDDIVFEDFDARTIRFPRNVLCLRMLLSGFFKESLERAKRYPVSDFSYDAFRSVLIYLLTGTVDVMMCKPIVTEVCLAADYYLVKNLRDQCLEYMIHAVTTESVSEYAKIAYLMKSAALKETCEKFSAENSSDH